MRRDDLLARPICLIAILLVLGILLVDLLFPDIRDKGYDPDDPHNPMSETGGSEFEWLGKVAAIKHKASYGDTYILELKDVSMVTDNGGVKLTGFGQSVQAMTCEPQGIRIGSYVAVTGHLSYYEHARNDGEFDAYSFYNNRGVLFAIRDGEIIWNGDEYSVVGRVMYETGRYFAERLEDTYDEEDAAILKAMLLGVKEDMDDEVKESFQKCGVAHILAISGLHITFLCMTLYNLLIRTGLRKQICVALSECFLILYVIMVGATASALRAGCMFTLFLSAKVLKRSYDMLTAVSFAAIMLLLRNPGVLWDVSFQLSFAAVLGVGLFHKLFMNNTLYLKEKLKMRHDDLLKNRLFNIFVHGTCSNALVSFFVYAVTLPVLLSCYYETAIYSILLNIIIVPLMSVLLVAAILGLILGNVIGLPAIVIVKSILYFYKNCCSWFEASGMGRVNLGAPDIWKVVLYYLLLLCLCIYAGRYRIPVRLGCLITCVMLMLPYPVSGLQVHVLDVGQGDGLVMFCDDKVFLFDGGSTSVRQLGKKRLIPFLKYHGVNKVDAVFLSHADKDHISGIYELLDSEIRECIEVKRIYAYDGALDNGDFDEMSLKAAEHDCKLIGISAGNMYCDKNLSISCVYPHEGRYTEPNNSSLVMKIDYGEFCMIETGDVENEGECVINEEYDMTAWDTDVLKVAHHGSVSSSGEAFLEEMKPLVSVISVAEYNPYGHPHRETMQRLSKNTGDIYMTSTCGCISIYVDKRGRFRVKSKIA